MTLEEKREHIATLIDTYGEEAATAMQQVADAEKAKHYEQWFKTELLGRKSNYRDQE